MNTSEQVALLDRTKKALAPDWFQRSEKKYQEYGDIGYLWNHRAKAVVAYFETGRPEAYWDNIRRVGELQIDLFKRFEAGERISESYVETTSLS